MDDSNYATLPHEDPQNQYRNPDGTNPMDPQVQLDSKRTLYHDVLQSGGHIVGTNHPAPVLFAGITNDPILGAKTHMYGFQNFAQWSPDTDAAVHSGEGTKSNFISLHRVEYLALIGPEVESSNVRELEGHENAGRGNRRAVVTHRAGTHDAGKRRNQPAGTGLRPGQPAVGRLGRQAKGNHPENRPQGGPDSDAGRDRVTPAPPGKFAIAKPKLSLKQEGERWVARAPDGTLLYSGRNKGWVELRGNQEFETWREANTPNPYANRPNQVGYRGVIEIKNPGSFGASEGNGVYIAKSKGMASFFSTHGKTTRISYKQPISPLVVDEEPLYILHESDEIMAPIRKGDSVWTRLNKQAVQNLGLTDDTFNSRIDDLTAELTRLMLDAGYDAVDVTSGGESWIVLLDPKLIEASGFKKPADQLLAQFSTPAALLDSLHALAGHQDVQALLDAGRLNQHY